MNPFANKFSILGRLSKIALLAVPCFVAAVLLRTHLALSELCFVTGMLVALPCLIYCYVLTLLHWKSRYRGRHSDLWGVLLLVEASSWCKVIYLFRHMIPDMKGRGRYGDM